MLIWGFVFAGVAFGVLIAFLWLADRELKEKNQRLQVAESKLAAASEGAFASSGRPATTDDARVAKLEEQLSALSDERSHLLVQVEALKSAQEASRDQVQRLSAAETRFSDSEHKIAQLGQENARLRAQIEDFLKEQNGREERVDLLENERAKIPELEQEVAKLKEEKALILGQLASLETERDSSRQRIELLESAQDRVPALERQVAELGREKEKLTADISALRSAVAEKLKAQVDDLQNLYRKLDAGQD